MLVRSRARKCACTGDGALKASIGAEAKGVSSRLLYRPECSVCKAFYKFNEPLTNHKIYPPGLLSSSKAGCEGCTIVKNAVTEIWHVKLDRSDIRELYLSFDPYPSKVSFDTNELVDYRLMIFAADYEGVLEKYPAIFLWKNTGEVGEVGELVCEDSIYPTIPVRRQILPLKNISKEIEWVNERLIDCDQHECCPQPKYSANAPKRLIDVGVLNGNKTSSAVRVVNTPNEFVKYTSLSYCWGTSSRKHVLTKKNLPRYQQAIPQAALLKTFADAIEITRQLGIRYIWIDAFCIVQDDADDWNCEAKKMCDVYRNSTLTLSALGFANPEEGLFKRSVDHVLLKLDSQNPPFAVYGKTLDDCPLRWTSNTGRISQHELPMMTRGWCYQERILAVRTVHFTREELAWDCRATFCCQCRPLNGDMSTHTQNEANPITAKMRHNQTFALDNPRILRQRWEAIVRDYTRLSLTVESDRLNAIHGVATEFQEKGLGTYSHGLWKETALMDLAWMKQDINSRSISYRKPYTNKRIPGIPTWSWGSLDAAVTFQGGIATMNRHDYATFIDIQTSRRESKLAFVPVLTHHRLVLRGQYAGGWMDRRRGLLTSPNAQFCIEGIPELDIDAQPGDQIRSNGYATEDDEEEGFYYVLRLCSVGDGSGYVYVQYLILRHVMGDIGIDAEEELDENKEGGELAVKVEIEAGEGPPVFERVGVMGTYVAEERLKEIDGWFETDGLKGVVMIQ